jgi:hypothetical protein
MAFLVNHVSHALTARMGEAPADLDLTASQYCVLRKAHEMERTQSGRHDRGSLA